MWTPHLLAWFDAPGYGARTLGVPLSLGDPHATLAFVDVPVSATQVLVVLTLVAALAYVWYVEGRGRWRSHVAERLLYGVPWGTAVTVAIVLAFYLLVQGGLWHWSDPLVLPFVSWSYYYGVGTLTAGFAHGSPEHLVSNLAATLALGPIAEYAWGHYADEPGSEAWITDPWLRAVVAFPAALLSVSVLTSVLSMVPSLGFSGAVFAIAGFAVITRPVPSMVGILAGSALGTVYGAITEPIVRGTVETGPPQPPTWAGIAVQAHGLGFLIGVLLGLGLLYVSDRRPVPERIFLATLLFGLVQGLWLVWIGTGQDAYVLYRGVGLVLLLLVTTLLTAAVAGVEDVETASQWRPSGRSVRIGAVAALLLLTALVALPGPVGSLYVVGADATPNDDGVTAGDYTVTYAENATSQRRLPGNLTATAGVDDERGGVIVASDEREIWTIGVRDDVLAHEGNATVTVGGVGWRETVQVDRVGWRVAGADTVYAVDLTLDEERTRAFGSAPVAADARVDGHEVTVAPGDETFRLVVTRDGTRVGATAIPDVGESSAVGDVRISTEVAGGTEHVFAESGDARVPVAERETFD